MLKACSIRTTLLLSLSIDGTRCKASLMRNTRSNTYVGGTTPNHMITIPDGTNEELKKIRRETIQDFEGESATNELATEVKIATITFQWVPDRKPA